MSIAFILSLLVIGTILLLIEIFVVPGVGISGILGVIALGGGCYLSFGCGMHTGMIVTGGVIVMIIILITVALRKETWEKLALNAQIDFSAGQDASKIAVGDHGITITRLAPMGTARIGDMTMEVKSWEGFLDPGLDVVVERIEDNIIYVRPLIPEA